MTSARVEVKHQVAGGLATDFGQRVPTAIGNDRTVPIPFLIEADNIVYNLQGGPRKAPGAAKLNSTALQSGADINGIYDAWFSGTSFSPSHHRVIYVDTTIKKDDANGTFTNLFTGLNADEIATFSMLEDVLVIALTGSDVPKSWDGSTAQNLAGSPPNFAISTVHANRMWAAGVAALPSRLYYSALLDPEDWTGSGSGHIDIDPDDGDIITAIHSYRGELIVFKGPYKGKIVRISGRAPTGPAPFAKDTFITGIGAVWQNSVFPFRDDLAFLWSDGSLNSLRGVDQFGDFSSASLTRGLENYVSERINLSQLRKAWATAGTDDDYALISVAIDGSTTNNMTLMMDYRFDPPRWATWSQYVSTSLTFGVDGSANNRRVFLAGGTDGFVRKYNQTDRTIDGSDPIQYVWRTPYVDYGEPFKFKTLGVGYVQFSQFNQGTIQWDTFLDGLIVNSYDIVPATGGDPLGTVSGMNFTLGVSVLSEATVVEQFVELEEGGEFRQVSYRFSNEGQSEDVEIFEFGVSVEADGSGSQN